MSALYPGAPMLPIAVRGAIDGCVDANVEIALAYQDREGVDRDLVVTLEDAERTSRRALDDAIRTAIADAEARGRAAALAELDAACDELADLDEFESVALWRIAPDRWRAEASASAESSAVGVGPTATNAILDLADCAQAVAP